MTDQLHRCLCYLVEHKKKDNYVFDAAEEKWMKARNKARSRESDWAKFYRYGAANTGGGVYGQLHHRHMGKDTSRILYIP